MGWEFEGKGLVNGRERKVKLVGEEDREFMLCRVGEEEGLLGWGGVVMVLVGLILGLIDVGEGEGYKLGGM